MAKTFPFKVLFWFENNSTIITEIKRTDIQSEDKSLVYKWIRIQKQNENENENENEKEKQKQNESIADFHQQQVFNRYGDESLRTFNENEAGISVLTFQSMESLGDKQVRVFAEGILEWNADGALFNGETMRILHPDNKAIEGLELLAEFLRKANS